MLNEVVRHLRKLAGLRATAGMTDSHLLERFLNQRDEGAFEALFARHAPMVLGVCRRMLPASHDAEEILLGEIDLGLIEETRRNWPFLRDRRIDAYAPITKRYLDPVNSWPADGDSK